ncbi:FidL-like protein [Providencia alcalifaciens]|uniref:FidL-like protein n=1 Tax=Providencia alcalifaciens TaxID=126385 RepID=UPI00044A3313|nr:FidL-like protein [Providencia alcalifaciens]ETT06760.1 hypothetical protein HMPREF1562_4154 [Providencia alcalifaciens F90-2004]EUC95410.1 hypothetical protein HMPREF1567_3994 [Providencia alcalifaciens PAL-2]MTB32549.1 hypothetical protein [Providencia alcalifaciens]MTC97686.1 hypothetical protein [Providencia alcalifaciens]
MKKYLITAALAAVIAPISYLTFEKEKEDIKLCHSEIVWIKENSTPEGIILKSKMSLQISDNHNGRMNFYGYIKNQETIYRLDRAVYFSYTPVDKKGNYAVIMNSSSVTNSDNTPNDVFSNFIQLEKDKIKYYVNVNKMEDNIYILKDEAYSAFICSAE